MASVASMAFMSHVDCPQPFHQHMGRFRTGNGSRGALLLPNLSHLSLSQRNHTACLRAMQCHPVICAHHPKIATVTRTSWESLVLKNKSPVLVEFYASWCGPCQMVHRVMDEIAVEYKGKLDCFVLNADNDSEVADEYEIRAVPVVLLFKNGMKHGSIVGTMPKELYIDAVDKLLAS